MAYHLTSLGYSVRSLQDREIGSRAYLRDVTQGRLKMREADAAALAKALGIEPDTLLQPLSDDEFNAWAFDSTSSRYRLQVWYNAQSAWKQANSSGREAARALGMSDGRLRKAFEPTSTRRLLYPSALSLTTSLSLLPGPRRFLSGLPHHWREGCAPLSRDA